MTVHVNLENMKLDQKLPVVNSVIISVKLAFLPPIIVFNVRIKSIDL
jgi:hypothetical protein